MEYDVNNSVILKCRVCFQEKDDLHSIFKRRKGSSAYDKLLSCTKLNIAKNDGGPSLICIECLKELEVTEAFLKKCEKSNEMLASLNLDLASKDGYLILDNDNKWYQNDDVNIVVKPSDIIVDNKKNEVCSVRTPVVQKCSELETSEFKCPLCGKYFKKKDNLKVHK